MIDLEFLKTKGLFGLGVLAQSLGKRLEEKEKMFDKLKEMRDTARRSSDTEGVTFFATVIGEIERVANKAPTKDECLGVIKKMSQNCEEYLGTVYDEKIAKQHETLKNLLPKAPTKEEIADVVSQNLSNIGAAMKAVRETFGVTVDMKIAKELFENLTKK